MREKLSCPPHPVPGLLGVIPELLCHPARATSGAELPDGTTDRIGHRPGSRGV